LPHLTPDLEEQVPDYQLWLEHGDLLGRLSAAFHDLGLEPRFARHALRWLSREVVESDRPLESIRTCLDKAESLLEEVESALELSGLPGELWDTLEEINTLLQFAARIRPLADNSLLGVLNPNSNEAHRFAQLSAEMGERQRSYVQAA